MDELEKTHSQARKPHSQKGKRSRVISHKSNMSNRLSNKSADRSLIRNEISKEDNIRMNTSVHEYNQSNYFNSMLSGRGFSKIDFEDDKWLHKSMSRDSQEESFETDSILPDKLATRLKTLIENDAQRVSFQGFDDEILDHSPDKKILERGKEMVRKSGYDVDFSGKLISKDLISSSTDQFMANKKYNTSLDLGVPKENKKWLENKIVSEKMNTPNEEDSKSKNSGSKEKDTLSDSETEIQGITSTKYSDWYCQDNYENMKQSRFKFDQEYDQDHQTQVYKTKSSEVEDGKEGARKHKHDQVSSDKEENVNNKISLQKFNTYTSKQSSKNRMISIDKSETDFFENGSFLNMGDNNSLVIGMDIDNNSIKNSIEE